MRIALKARDENDQHKIVTTSYMIGNLKFKCPVKYCSDTGVPVKYEEFVMKGVKVRAKISSHMSTKKFQENINEAREKMESWLD